MHKLNILISAPESFLSSLDELKHYLKFKLITKQKNTKEISLNNYNGFICLNKSLRLNVDNGVSINIVYLELHIILLIFTDICIDDHLTASN